MQSTFFHKVLYSLILFFSLTLKGDVAQAKVSNDFDFCKDFFFKKTEPTGMDQNAKKICQCMSDVPYYATLYSVHHRIPLYSAYRFDLDCKKDSGSSNIWYLEPQVCTSRSNKRLSLISEPNSETQCMVSEKQKLQNNYKLNQAISSDYTKSGYDRGHLNPNSFQCGVGRTATSTLTNAAPMDPCFNRVHWKDWESTLRDFLQGKLNNIHATAYIVTGTVPNANIRIPQKEISKDPERVTVPSHIWTAVCYEHSTDDKESFSFGYMGTNQPQNDIKLMSVSELNRELSKLYRVSPDIKIFKDDCFGDNKSDDVKATFNEIMSLNVQNTRKRTISSDSLNSETNVKVQKN
uniref:Endonuclease domain-containing 1 protein n=1 Tax=Cyprinus carpio carpio TaxID=630221 RepID=A0A8C1FVT8_CYPCA